MNGIVRRIGKVEAAVTALAMVQDDSAQFQQKRMELLFRGVDPADRRPLARAWSRMLLLRESQGEVEKALIDKYAGRLTEAAHFEMARVSNNPEAVEACAEFHRRVGNGQFTERESEAQHESYLAYITTLEAEEGNDESE